MSTRKEKDSFGYIEVPADRLWGAQTQRSLEHFRISTEKVPPELVMALAEVKRAANFVGLAREEPHQGVTAGVRILDRRVRLHPVTGGQEETLVEP